MLGWITIKTPKHCKYFLFFTLQMIPQDLFALLHWFLKNINKGLCLVHLGDWVHIRMRMLQIHVDKWETKDEPPLCLIEFVLLICKLCGLRRRALLYSKKELYFVMLVVGGSHPLIPSFKDKRWVFYPLTVWMMASFTTTVVINNRQPRKRGLRISVWFQQLEIVV